MANYNQVFVETKLSLDDFAAELSSLIGCPLQRWQSEEYSDEVDYMFISDKVAGGLKANIYGDDDDLPLARYQYKIDARPLRLGKIAPAVTDRWRDEFLQHIYDSLKSTRQFPIAFVLGLGLFIERYDPKDGVDAS